MTDRCTVCDRETCEREAMAHKPLSGNVYPYFQAHNDCEANRVDWRARAMKAEERVVALSDVAERRGKRAEAAEDAIARVRNVIADLKCQTDFGNDCCVCCDRAAMELRARADRLNAALDGSENA